MELSEEDKINICKILKKKNRIHWTDSICNKAVEIVQKIRDGDVKLTDWFVPNILTFEDYLYNVNLIQFIDGT
jgi:hypothetical protein